MTGLRLLRPVSHEAAYTPPQSLDAWYCCVQSDPVICCYQNWSWKVYTNWREQFKLKFKAQKIYIKSRDSLNPKHLFKIQNSENLQQNKGILIWNLELRKFTENQGNSLNPTYLFILGSLPTSWTKLLHRKLVPLKSKNIFLLKPAKGTWSSNQCSENDANKQHADKYLLFSFTNTNASIHYLLIQPPQKKHPPPPQSDRYTITKSMFHEYQLFPPQKD